MPAFFYTRAFFARQREHARSSAETVVPLVLELTGARSVVDVGCGTGTWLAAFAAHGIADVFGVDGAYVDADALEIARERFLAHDLTRPLELPRRFDLVVSLEVAEHLPADDAATLVESLTGLGPIVLFSAAIPGQGGTNHVNEQWPAYWAALFAERGYVHVDCLRRRLWHDETVEYWYAQNSFFYVSAHELSRYERLSSVRDPSERVPPALVHPTRYMEWVDWARGHDCGAPNVGVGSPS
jgi:SAM-dependent methyltransferase